MGVGVDGVDVGSLLAGIKVDGRSDIGVSELAADTRIVLPFSGEFGVFGGEREQERGKLWALLERVAQVRGVAGCAHGFVGLAGCPGGGGGGGGGEMCRRLFDHGMMWVPVDEDKVPRPFLLAHVYEEAGEGSEYRRELDGYAQAWGLDVMVDGGGFARDGWYADGRATAVRVWVGRGGGLWPLERDLALLLRVCPVTWPDDEGMTALYEAPLAGV